jgi:outer membrane protein OmpA-like peptidoglycan-associated protein
MTYMTRDEMVQDAHSWRFLALAAGLGATTLLTVVVSLLLAVPPARASASVPEPTSSRERTLAILQSVVEAGGGFALQARVNDGGTAELSVGDDLAYHFVSERDAWLTVVHVDSHGVVTLIYPNDVGSNNRLEPGVDHIFPAHDAEFGLRVEPPIGKEVVLAVATSAPIAPADLGISFEGDPIAVFDAPDAPAFAERLLERFSAFAPDGRAVARVDQRVLGRSEAAQYRSGDIVDYFTTRSRAIKRPRLDLHVRFATGSHSLDAKAKRNLDEVASALSDDRMATMRFTVSGHTDDVGDDAYNDWLSEARAKSVVQYLTQQRGLGTERLEVEYFGERRPLESGTTVEARRMNRRVEFELIR